MITEINIKFSDSDKSFEMYFVEGKPYLNCKNISNKELSEIEEKLFILKDVMKLKTK